MRVVLVVCLLGLAVLSAAALGLGLVSPQASAPPTPSVQVRDMQVIAHLSPTAAGGQPAFLAREPDGKLVVSDRIGRRILRFDDSGNQISAWGPQLGSDFELHDPGGVAATNDTWYVLDRTEPWILRLDASGTVQSHIDLSPLGLYGPNGLAVDSAGLLYVADTGGNRILIFGPDGQLLRSFGAAGNNVGELRQPMSLAAGPGGELAVADWENGRIERWGPDFQAINALATGYRPWDVAVDSLGRIFALNTDRHNVDVFAPGGDYLAELGFGYPGLALDFPSQLVVTPDGSTLFVLGHDGLLKISLDQLPAPPPRPSVTGWLVGELPGLFAGLALGLVLGGLAFGASRTRSRTRLVLPFVRQRSDTQPRLEPGGWRPWRQRFWSAETPSAEPHPGPVAALQTSPRHARRALVAMLVIVGVAILVRVVNLTTIPIGLHGDEGATGLEAQRIMHQIWIGPYSPLALGRPSGPMYLAVPAVALLGNSIIAVRITPALAGACSVLVLFWLVRSNLGTPTALVSAGVLALMNWDIHLSRVAFNLSAWGLFAVLCAWALFAALRSKQWRWWAASGALAGAGVYMYQAHWLLLGILAAFLGVLVVVGVPNYPRARLLLDIAVFGMATLVVALPMILWAADPANGYSSSFTLVSTFTKPEWLSLSSPLARLGFIVGRYFEYWDQMCCHPAVDLVDGTGGVPIVPLLLLGLALIGVLLALIHRRTPLVVLGTLILLLMPFGAVVTIDGPARRTFALAPILALFAGVAVVELIRLARTQGRATAWLARGALACVLVVTAYQNLQTYFVQFPGSEADRWVFAVEMTDAARYMATLPPDRHVYFMASRWSVKYESVEFLAQNVTTEDRSNEFGQYSLDVNRSQGVPVFVLLGSYQASLADLQQRYPGGTVTTGGPPANPSFIAYTDFDR